MTSKIFIGVLLGASALAISACSATVEDGTGTTESAATGKIDCSFVKCAVPQCADGQHLAQNEGTCCPVCKGHPSRCATVLCAAVACAEGEVLVRNGANDCCGSCQKAKPAPECTTDLDCPQIMCVRCPCPVSECRGRQCVTRTPAESTCGPTQ